MLEGCDLTQTGHISPIRPLYHGSESGLNNIGFADPKKIPICGDVNDQNRG